MWLTANTARRGGEPVAAQHELRVRGYADKPDAFLVVADDAGEVTGMALGMQACADDGAGPPVSGLCHIAMVFVAPDRWGEGVGGQLVDAVLAEARDRGYDRAQLWTHVDNGRGASGSTTAVASGVAAGRRTTTWVSGSCTTNASYRQPRGDARPSRERRVPTGGVGPAPATRGTSR